MTATYSTQAAKRIIKKSMLSFGIDRDMETDPDLIKTIIREFKLDDFETSNEVMADFLKGAKAKPQKLRPLFDTIEKGILSKHPAIIEFAQVALKKIGSTNQNML